MRLRVVAIFAIVALALCYVGAGVPPIALLLKPSVVSDGLALKFITWHWTNYADRALSKPELIASRFYVLLIAALCILGAWITYWPNVTRKNFFVLLALALGLLCLLVYAQYQAYYLVA
jgi:hypothetical protein